MPPRLLSEAEVVASLRGQRVAVVGNAAFVLEQRHGAAIEAADVVVRMNAGVPGPEHAQANGDPMVITRYLYKPTAGEGLTRFNDNRRTHVFVTDVGTRQVTQLTDGATYEQKLQLYKETTEMLMRILNKKPEYTFVVIEEVDNKSWGHMGTSVHEIRMSQAAGGAVPGMGMKFTGGKAAHTTWAISKDWLSQRSKEITVKPE